MSRHRPGPPARSSPFIQNRFCAAPRSRWSYPPAQSASSAVSTGGRSSRFRALDSDRGDRVTQIEEAHRGAAAQSLNRLIALAISGGSVGSVGSVGRVAARGRAVKSTAVLQDGPIPSAARLEPSRPRHCLDEPLSPLVLSHFQLACRSQRHPCPQASLPVGIPNPHMALLSNAPQRIWSTCNWPPSLSLLLVAAHSRRHFFACSSKPLRLAHTARPDDAAFFSLASSHSP